MGMFKIQKDFRRGKAADRLADLLFLTMLAVLAMSMYHGVRTL